MKYEGVSDELLERIARDVRAWDKSRTPDVASQKALESLAADINDHLTTLKRDAIEAADARRRTVEAAEIQAVAAVLNLDHGPNSLAFAQSQSVTWLLRQYGVNVEEGS